MGSSSELIRRLVMLMMLLVQSHLGVYVVVVAGRHQRHYMDSYDDYRRTLTTPSPSNTFVFRDCGMSNDRPIRVLDVSARPSPIRTPGRVKLSAVVNVTDDLPTALNADVLVSKSVLGVHLKIPCYRNLGSCHYEDLCSLLDALFPTDRHCPRVLRRHRIPCRCPFNVSLLNLTRYSFRMPRFEGFMKKLAIGEYEVMVRLYSDVDKRELGCVQLLFNMQQKRRRSASVRRRRARKRAYVATSDE